MNNERYYNVFEIAQMVGRDPATVRTWIYQGYLKAEKVKGTSPTGYVWHVAKKDLDKFLADRHIQESFVQNEAGVKTIPATLIYRDKIRAMIEDAIRAEIQRAVKEAVSSVMNDIIAA